MAHYNYYFMHGRETINESENIQIYNSAFDTTVHKHDFVELVYFISGVGKHFIGTQAYPISNGHFCLLNAGEEHYYHIDAATKDREIEVKNLIFFPSFLSPKIRSEHFIDDCYELLYEKKNPTSQSYIQIDKDANKLLANLLNIIETELTLKKNGYLNIVRHSLWAILQIIFREANETNENPSLPLGTIQKFDQMLAYLEKNYAQDVTLKTLANQIGYSTVHFNSLFKRYTGLTYRKYIQKLRCEKARDMLISTNKSITQIREDVGYYDPKQFFSLFKNQYGITPLKYRQAHLKSIKKGK